MINNADNLKLGFDLQLFSEGETPTEDSSPAAPTEPVETFTDPRENMSLAEYFNREQASGEDNTPTTTVPVEETGGSPDSTQQTPEPRIEIPDKFKNPDGSVNVEALAKSYTNMERLYSKSQNPQQFEALQQQNQMLQQQFTALMETMQQQAAQNHPQATAEELAALEEAEIEKFWDEYNENPKTAIENIIRNVVSPILEPIQQERQFQQEVQAWNEKVNAFAQTKPDFEEMLPEIREVVAEFGDVLTSRDDAIEMAYNLAKARQAEQAQAQATQAPPPTVEDMLKDSNVLAQIVQDPNIKKMILDQHMQDIKNNTAPPTIGSQAGGFPPSTEPVDLTNIKNAKEALKAKYAGINLV